MSFPHFSKASSPPSLVFLLSKCPICVCYQPRRCLTGRTTEGCHGPARPARGPWAVEGRLARGQSLAESWWPPNTPAHSHSEAGWPSSSSAPSVHTHSTSSPVPCADAQGYSLWVSWATRAQESGRGGGKGHTGEASGRAGEVGVWRHEGDHLHVMLATPDDVGSHP